LCSACTADWAQWGGSGTTRQGWSDFGVGINPGNVNRLQHKWSVNLGGYINASPILATGVDVDGTPTDVIYVGTERGMFYAVSAAGRVLWSRNLGSIVVPDCPDTPGNVYGVSASAAYDRTRNAVYVEGGDGQVYALNPTTGATLSGWPVRITTIPNTEVVFGAPTLIGNHLYYVISAHCDTIPYHGRVVDIDITNKAVAHTWYSNGPTGPDGGGIWGWGGASVDPANGDVYVVTSNSRAEPENGFWSESVVRLSSTLQFKAGHNLGFDMRDDGPGSTPVLFQKNGCPPQLVVEQKHGSVYLYDRDSIAGGYKQRIRVIDTPDPVTGPHEPGLIGVNLYYPRTQMVYVITPRDKADGTFKQGLIAFRINANCRLEVAWQSSVPTSIAATATIANNVAFVVGGFNGKVYAVDARTGARLWDSGTSVTGPVLAAPIIHRSALYAGGYDNRLHAWGL
jgi:putative pyrroloquinoline-quinone-binding quinoprotein/putative pyrroloquinoline-quinone binding quinoprotein